VSLNKGAKVLSGAVSGRKDMKICVNSQTPFIRFKLRYDELLEKYGSLSDPINIKELEEGVDYDYSPGGVTATIYPSVKKLMQQGFLTNVVWVSLGVNYPPRVITDGILISHVEIGERDLREYTTFKEGLWSEIHGLGNPGFTLNGFRAYARYNWANAERMFDHISDTDVFYVQDFQQLLTGSLIGPPAPAVLRWHIPYSPDNMGPFTRRFVVRTMEGFDVVVVSTRRDLEGLIRSEYRGKAYQLYPYIDPDDWAQQPGSDATDRLVENVKLKKDEDLVLVVARMDRIKSQDVAIRATAEVLKRRKVKLVLIGNGSFSSSKRGGLGHGKGASWRAELEQMVRDLKLEESVTFLGHASREELKAAYNLSSVVLLTSRLEGFGITVLEGWMHRKPVVVSTGAGVSELVVNGSNGYTFPSGDADSAAEALMKALGADADKLGDYGYETSKQCHIDVAIKREKEILEEASKAFRLRE
jgi:glycosyltransferase involved in cell wall biosynthesis